MKRMLVLALVALMGLAVLSFAQEAKKEEAAKSATLTGEVIDLYCYMDKKAMGADHAKCAASCISKGLPVGLLTADGTIYLITGKAHEPANAAVAEFAGKQATITGKVMEQGAVKAIELVSIAGAKEEKKSGY